MKIILNKTLVSGKRRVVMELDHDESIITVRDNTHYKMGYPLDDIVPGHMLKDSVPANWCAIGQKWET